MHQRAVVNKLLLCSQVQKVAWVFIELTHFAVAGSCPNAANLRGG